MKRKNVVRHLALLLAVMMVSSSPCTVLADSEPALAGTGTEEIGDTAENEESDEGLISGTKDLEPEEETLDGEAILRGTGDTEESALSGIADIPSGEAEKLITMLEKGQAYLKSKLDNPIVGTIGGDWSVMALARYGNLDGAVKDNYLGNVVRTVSENDGALPDGDKKHTEYSRVVLGLSSVGVDPTDIMGYSLLYPLADHEKVCSQGTNGPIWALIAVNCGNYNIPLLSEAEQKKGRVQATKEKYISTILDLQLSDGGWVLDNDRQTEADVDMTAMAIQALAPYYSEKTEVRTAVDRGLDLLSSKQESDGGYSSWGESNIESIAQTIIALASLDPSLLTDEKFIKNGNSLLDAIALFQTGSGGFCHTLDGEKQGEINDIATDQGNLALTAYYRAVHGQTALYDMTDVIDGSKDEESTENIEAFKKRLQKLPETLTLDDTDEVYKLYAAIGLMGDFQEKAALMQTVKEKVDDISAQWLEVSQLNGEIWTKINPLKISLDDKAVVADLMDRYNKLPEANKKQKYIDNLNDLLNADIIIRKLEQGVLGKEIFEYVKSSSTNYTYKGDGYTITLVGKNNYTPADMKYGIYIEEGEDGCTFTISEEGDLPGTVNVTISCSLADGTYDLYWNDGPALKKMSPTIVKNGAFTCFIKNGGTYFLKKNQKEPQMTALAGIKPAASSGKETGTGSSSGKQNSQNTSGGTGSGSSKKDTKDDKTITAEIKDGIVEAKAFEDIKGKDKNLVIKGKTEDGKEYTFTINGKDVKKAADFNAGLSNKSENEADIKKLSDAPFILHFEQSGDFPGVMQVETPVEKKDGDYLLFYYNAKERKAEYVQKVAVKDKKTKFLISKGGDYFIDLKAKVKSLNEESTENKETAKMDTAAADASVDLEDGPVLAGTKEEHPEKSGFLVLPVVAVVLCGGGVGAVLILLKKRRQ